MSLGGFRIIRVVKRGQALARTAETGVAGRTTPESMLSLLSLMPLLIANPELAALIGGVAGVSFVSQYYQPGLGGWILPDSLSASQYAQKIQRLTLEKMFGQEAGSKIYYDKFRTVQDEIDLRTKVP